MLGGSDEHVQPFSSGDCAAVLSRCAPWQCPRSALEGAPAGSGLCRHSQRERQAGSLVAQPLPRVLERAFYKASDFTASAHSGADFAPYLLDLQTFRWRRGNPNSPNPYPNPKPDPDPSTLTLTLTLTLQP